MTLGETIKLLRTELGLTQPELADKAGIEQSYLSKLENDKGTPSFDIINRIAQALNLTGMALIHKLSHSYISENLSHLPEIAAEYATVRQRREMTLTRRLLMSALLLLAGTAIFLVGRTTLLDSNEQFFYVSEGILMPGEHPEHFADYPINSIGETTEEFRARLIGNRGRIDRVYFQSDTDRGDEFITENGAERRLYWQRNSQQVSSKLNQTAQVLGLVCALAGVLLAAWAIWRGRGK